MERLFTLRNSLKKEIVSEGLKQPKIVDLNSKESSFSEEQVFQPSDDTIDLLLNYSKALSAQETKIFGTVFNVLN